MSPGAGADGANVDDFELSPSCSALFLVISGKLNLWVYLEFSISLGTSESEVGNSAGQKSKKMQQDQRKKVTSFT